MHAEADDAIAKLCLCGKERECGKETGKSAGESLVAAAGAYCMV